MGRLPFWRNRSSREVDTSRAARLLAIMQALRRRWTAVTAAGLAAEIGVSVRTLYRDIANLRGAGAPIAGAAGPGYLLERGFSCADLLGTPVIESSPTFAMLPPRPDVALGLWCRHTAEPGATASGGGGEIAFTAADPDGHRLRVFAPAGG